jgi:hypothetical protein
MDINPKVPESVQRVLLKALSKDRDDRYKTVDELVKAFKSAWIEAGVPMKGTAITMRPARLKAEEKPQGVDSAGKTAVSKSPASKRSPWVWMGVGLAAILCCGVGLFTFRANILSLMAQPTAVVNSPVPELDVPPNTELPPMALSNEPPQVIAAREEVAKNPGDPNAHLQLSLALWDVERRDGAMETLAQAANLAGPTNENFFLSAAQAFKDREAWVPAAGMYMRLTAIYREEDMPMDMKDDLYEAVYKAAEAPDMPLFVFFERIDGFNLPLGYVVRGRYALYNGEINETRLQIANAGKVKSDMYELFLLTAEFEMKTGSQTQARNILLSLSSDLGAPEWVRMMAGEFLKTME